MAKREVTEIPIEDLVPDEHNANIGTERGLRVLDDSLRGLGAGRSVLLDRDNRLIAGNKTTERAVDIGIKKVIVIDSDGTELVAVRRTDLDLEEDEEHRARRMAYADNRSGQLNLEWSLEQIHADLGEGVDLSGMWNPSELSLFTGPPDLDDLAEEYGEPDARDFWPVIRVQVSPETYDLWDSLVKQTGIEDEGEAMARILGAVDVATL